MENVVYVSVLKECGGCQIQDDDEVIAINKDFVSLFEETANKLEEECAMNQPSLRLPDISIASVTEQDCNGDDMWVVTLKDLDNDELYVAHIYKKNSFGI